MREKYSRNNIFWEKGGEPIDEVVDVGEYAQLRGSESVGILSQPKCRGKS